MPGMPPAAEETVKTVNVTSPGSDTQLKQGVNERSNGFWNRAWGCGGIAQVVIALVISIAGFMPTWQVAKTRQTNIDLVANSLRQLASPDDLVVVVPWYDGISFQRYFKGPAIWTTAPPMGFNLFHRYDLIKSLMVVSNQEEVVKPVLAQIETCFQAGHRVWLVGEGALPRPEQRIRMLPGAPAKPFGWHEQPYTLTWTLETQLYFFENLWLKVFEGK